MVHPCTPSERCLGGRFHECAEGYIGDFCSQCAEGYYEAQSVCVPCESTAFIIMLYAIQVPGI